MSICLSILKSNCICLFLSVFPWLIESRDGAMVPHNAEIKAAAGENRDLLKVVSFTSQVVSKSVNDCSRTFFRLFPIARQLFPIHDTGLCLKRIEEKMNLNKPEWQIGY